MITRFTYLPILLALFLPIATQAQVIEGKVIAIADGDTLTVLDDSNTQHKIRLAGIDAPEIGHGRKKPGQPFGQKSRQSLSELCFGKEAKVEDKGHDRYRRTIGRIRCDGIDANAEQIRRGMAWVYDKYVTDRSLYPLQEQARADHRGLWADASPIPPWEWRHPK